MAVRRFKKLVKEEKNTRKQTYTTVRYTAATIEKKKRMSYEKITGYKESTFDKAVRLLPGGDI